MRPRPPRKKVAGLPENPLTLLDRRSPQSTGDLRTGRVAVSGDSRHNSLIVRPERRREPAARSKGERGAAPLSLASRCGLAAALLPTAAGRRLNLDDRHAVLGGELELQRDPRLHIRQLGLLAFDGDL